ncbi:hypothetical protein [Rhodococcus zopfii]|uniref:hypothetical protein n=1 Tax=Rhodococcus zopfii TaxID=43772 RepID=UPI0035293FEF
MAPLSPAARSKRAKIAALSRDREPNDPELLETRRDLRALKLEEYVTRVVAEAPPLTDEQRERIASLLRAGGDAA